MICYYVLQLNGSGQCNPPDRILVSTTGTNIVATTGPCIVLTGPDTIANFTKVLMSARYDCHVTAGHMTFQ